MAEYSLLIKQSAQEELDALDNVVFIRVDRKFWRWPTTPGLQDARS